MNFSSLGNSLSVEVVDDWHVSVCVCLSQSCHIGEEDEGGEEVEGGEDEMSFEVRQTELVWGGRGLGNRGVTGAAAPHAPRVYIRHCTPCTPPAPSPPPHPRPFPYPDLFPSLSARSSCNLPLPDRPGVN